MQFLIMSEPLASQTPQRAVSSEADPSPLPKNLPTDTQDSGILIPEPLFNRLVHINVLQLDDATVIKDEQALLCDSVVPQYLNGYVFARYMIALKKLVKDKSNQDLNFSFPKLLQLSPVVESQLQNWMVIQQQLDKCGITVDEENMTELQNKQQEPVARLFTRIERFIKITCSQKFLDSLTEDPIPNVFDELNLSQMQDEEMEVFESSEFSDRNYEKERLLKHFKSKAIEVGQKEKQKEYLLKQEKKGVEVVPIPFAEQSPQISLASQAPKKNKRITEGVNIYEICADCDLNQCQNTLELILVTLSRALDLQPQQAAALLANGNQFLITACDKGVNGGQFSPVLEWYQLLKDNSTVVSELLIAEQAEFRDVKSIHKLIGTLACGLYSQNLQVITVTLEFMLMIFEHAFPDEEMQEITLGWFLSTEQGCLKLTLQALKLHSELAPLVVEACNLFCTVADQLTFMYKNELQNHCRSQLEYTMIISDLLRPLQEAKGNELIDCGLVEYFVDVGAREAENDGHHTSEERLSALTLLTEVWLLFRAKLHQDCQNTILYMYRKELREPCQMKSVVICQMFTLLEVFAGEKLSAAPALYKCLAQNLCEEHNHLVRETYIYNFMQMFHSNPSIPIAILAEPFVRAHNTWHGSLTEFQLLRTFAAHRKLTIPAASGLITLCVKVFFTNLSAVQLAGHLVLSLLSQFIFDMQVFQIGQDFAQQCVSILIDIELAQNQPAPKQLRRSPSSSKSILPNKVQDAMTQYHKQAVFLMLQKLQNFPEYSQFLKQTLTQGNKRLIGIAVTTIDHLLSAYHDTAQSTMQLVPFTQETPVTKKQPDLCLPQRSVLPPKVPKTVINKAKVMQDILKLKQLKEDRIFKLIQSEKKQILRQEKAKVKLRAQIEYRRQLLGVPQSKSGLVKAASQKMIEYQPALSRDFSNKEVVLVDLNDLEAHETIDVLLFTRQRKKLFKGLWQKYAGTAFRRDVQLSVTSMSMADLVKMLRDLNISIKLSQVKLLVRQISGVGEALQALSFEQFKYFMVQAALLTAFLPETVLQSLTRFFGAFERPEWNDQLAVVQKREYKVSESLKGFIPEATVIVTEILDSLIGDLMGVHLLEPFFVTHERRPLSLVAEPLARTICKHTEDTGLASTLVKLFDELLTSAIVQTQQKSALVVHQSHISNQATSNLQVIALSGVITDHTKEIKRISRDLRIKQELEHLRQERHQRELQAALDQEHLLKVQEYQRQRKEHRLRMDMLRLMQEARFQRQEKQAQQQPQPEPERPKMDKESYKKHFLKYEAHCLRLSQSNSDLNRKRQELLTKEMDFVHEMKRKSLVFTEQRKAVFEKDKMFQAQLQAFMESPETVQLYQTYGKFMSQMFRFYCKQAKQSLSGDLESHQTQMKLKEFVKFGYQSKIVPVMLLSEELILVYRAVQKQTQSDLMTLDGFKLALQRIALVAYDKLLETAKERVSTQIRTRLDRRQRSHSRLEAQVMEEMRSEFMQKWQRGAYQGPSPLMEMEFARWMKQQANLNQGLEHRILRLKAPHQTRQPNQLQHRQLSQKLQTLESLSKAFDSNEKPVSRHPDASNLSVDLVKSLLDFCGMIPGDCSKREIDDVLNRQRIENSGQKPQMTIKRILLPRIRESVQDSSSHK